MLENFPSIQKIIKDEAKHAEKEIWELVYSKKKYVLSKTHNKEYPGANLISCNLIEEVKKIKNEPGKEIWLYGGASLVIIDEQR